MSGCMKDDIFLRHDVLLTGNDTDVSEVIATSTFTAVGTELTRESFALRTGGQITQPMLPAY